MKECNADVAIIASGPAGLAAAVTAAEEGLTVVVFEKQGTTGGSANMGMGPFAAGSKIQKKNLIGLTADEAFDKFMNYTHWRVDARLVRKYMDKSADTIEWLEGMGVEFYDSAKFFPSSEATWHRVKPESGLPGPRSASSLLKAMTERAKELGVEFYMKTPARKILMEEGCVSGVLAVGQDGEEVLCRCDAAIIATGGFSSNPKMVNSELHKEIGKNLFLFPIPGLEGDGIRMAWEAGAAKSDIYWEMTYCMPFSNDGAPEISRVFCQPNLLVNKFGERFINEAIMENTTFTGNAINIQPGSYAFSIIDSSIVKLYEKQGMDTVSLVYPYLDLENFHAKFMASKEAGNPDLIYADTLEELAVLAGIDPNGLVRSVEEYNKMCITGDALFNKPKEYMRPIKEGPFYAGRFFPSGYGTLGGIKVNHKMEAIDADFNPVKGLYAAGTDACSIYGDSYVFILPGNTMGFCLNSGRIAAESAADYIFED